MADFEVRVPGNDVQVSDELRFVQLKCVTANLAIQNVALKHRLFGRLWRIYENCIRKFLLLSAAFLCLGCT